MSGFRALLALLLFAALWLPQATGAFAQEFEPQRWRHLPIDTNFVAATWIHTDGEIALDPILGFDDARMTHDMFAVTVTRTFEFFGTSAQVRLLQPWLTGTWSGTLDGAAVDAHRAGFADTELRLAMHLFGAPPLDRNDLAVYRAKNPVRTTAGFALGIQIPTGEYMEGKLVNLGFNRFAIRPEIGIVHDRGDWSFEASGIVSFYTDNDSYVGNSTLELEPLWFGQANVLHRVTPEFWIAAGGGYAIGARSTVNGNRNDDRRENLIWGIAAGYSLTPQWGITLKYFRSENQADVGISSDRYIVTVSALW